MANASSTTVGAPASIADVEPPDGVRSEHYVIRAPRSATVAVVDEQIRLLMMWRHRFVIDRWVWDLPGGYLDDDETRHSPQPARSRRSESPGFLWRRPPGTLRAAPSSAQVQ
jgi:ADP-ribose pyrophosphatase